MAVAMVEPRLEKLRTVLSAAWLILARSAALPVLGRQDPWYACCCHGVSLSYLDVSADHLGDIITWPICFLPDFLVHVVGNGIDDPLLAVPEKRLDDRTRRLFNRVFARDSKSQRPARARILLSRVSFCYGECSGSRRAPDSQPTDACIVLVFCW